MAEQLERVVASVLRIIEEDYAGQPECDPRNQVPQLIEALVADAGAGALDDGMLMRRMAEYLGNFQDPALSFEASPQAAWKPATCGFSVRRFGDELYVTEVREDDRLVRGDAIVALEGRSLDEHRAFLVGNPVNGDDPERQLWDEVLARCAQMTVRHADGTQESLPVRLFPKPEFVKGLRPPTVEVREDAGPNGDERAAIITVHHFVDGSLLAKMQERFADIQQAQRVIVDMRDAEEGVIGNAFPLMALFFDSPVNLKELMGEEPVLTRYTERNARLRRRQLERLLAMSDASGKSWVQAEIEHVAACAGKGYVKEIEYEEDMLFPPAPEGQKTLLLTDVRTCGPAERLVAIAQRAAACGCGRARSVGRATRGGLDYENLVAVAFDEKFSLVYPVSKTEAAHAGCGVLGRGIAPDVHVPFTPEECHRDVVLKRALVEP